MAMELKLVPKLQQSLVMTPQLKMAIKLLTLNHLELKDAVAQELVDNPVLEEAPDDAPIAGGMDAEGTGQAQPQTEGPREVSLGDTNTNPSEQGPQIDWEAYADSYSYLPPSAGSGKDSSFDDLPGIDQTLTRSETLEEHLLWQVRMSDMNSLEREIAARLIGEMNDDGFLDRTPVHAPPAIVPAPEVNGNGHAAADDLLADDDALLADGPAEEEEPAVPEPALLADGPAVAVPGAFIDPVELVALEMDVPHEWIENVRQRVMMLDPVGCMARDLRECLLAQLQAWGYDDECLVYAIVDRHMKDVEKRNYAAIGKACKVSHEDVGEALKILEQLEPRPARNYIAQGTSPDAQYITPDVYIHKLGEDFIISLNEDGLPKLKMSRFYLNKLREEKKAGDQSKSYIKDKMRSATWLIRSIHQRQRTIYKVVESILKHQRDWFDGKGPLKPLILKEVADDIGMHESTVSRVTSRKYMHTHRGIFELKYFFNSSIATGDGTNIASEAVKDEIKRIISDENPKKPLSDAAIVKMLAGRNIDIARRTVAKYREMLGILPSNRRKQVF
jgi:RNA polymerase sigma-54 factor